MNAFNQEFLAILVRVFSDVSEIAISTSKHKECLRTKAICEAFNLQYNLKKRNCFLKKLQKIWSNEEVCYTGSTLCCLDFLHGFWFLFILVQKRVASEFQKKAGAESKEKLENTEVSAAEEVDVHNLGENSNSETDSARHYTVNVSELHEAVDVIQSQEVMNFTEPHEIIYLPESPESDDQTRETSKQVDAHLSFTTDTLRTDKTLKSTCKSPGSRLSHLVGQRKKRFYQNRFDSSKLGNKLLFIDAKYVLGFKFNQCDCLT